MTPTENRELLLEYAKNGSETAFRELVGRYTDFVYSVALRLTGGDAHLAQDVSQQVFLDLARKAGRLSESKALGGWLHRHTCFVSATMMRGERRRKLRERLAMEMNRVDEDHSDSNFAQLAPVLDDAINQLGADDRQAIILRFFDRNDYPVMGGEMGISESGARMRVTRALEKLHLLLKRRGVALSGAGLAAALASEAVTAAPAGLAVAFSSGTLAAVASGSGAAVAAIKIITMTKIKVALVGTLAAVVLATPIVLQHRTVVELRGQNQSLRAELEQLNKQPLDGDEQGAVSAHDGGKAADEEQKRELLKLRGEVGVLRRETNALAAMLAQNQRAAATLKSLGGPQVNKAAVQPENNFPKESWAFAGYATPEAALQTWTWAMSKGDTKIMVESLSPEGFEKMGKSIQSISQEELQREFIKKSQSITGYQILNREAVTDDQVVLHLSMSGSTNVPPMRLVRIAGEWRVAGP